MVKNFFDFTPNPIIRRSQMLQLNTNHLNNIDNIIEKE